MKKQVFLCISGIFLLIPLLAKAFDSQAVYETHLAWKAAFEKMDINAIDKIWSHEKDTMLITLGGETKNGWKEIQAELLFSFQIVGETQIDESNLLITIAENDASATSDYHWSPLPNVPLRATELYRKENSVWKMIAQDGAGGLEPLRKNAEIRVREQVQQALDALAGADVNKLAGLTADQDFTYVALNGMTHQEFDDAVIAKDLEQIQEVHLAVVYLIDEVATAHLTLTLIGNNEQKIELVYENFQLTTIDFSPKPLAVHPRGKLTTTWGQIKRGNR